MGCTYKARIWKSSRKYSVVHALIRKHGERAAGTIELCFYVQNGAQTGLEYILSILSSEDKELMCGIHEQSQENME